MELLVAVGGIGGCAGLLDISAAHIDGGLYHGQAGLDFALTLVRKAVAGWWCRQRSMCRRSIYSIPSSTGETRRPPVAARLLMDAYVDMGCTPSWTCAPYQLAQRPGLGDQIAWGESNAIVFANSVLGARTARYGDFLDICCALTGRAPAVGLHTDEGRRATLRVDLQVPDEFSTTTCSTRCSATCSARSRGPR